MYFILFKKYILTTLFHKDIESKCALYNLDTDAMCMIDIGMIEGRITSDQITTTDKSPVNIDSFRAYNSGWCTSVEDKRPYIQVCNE